ncbi:MAG TPA: adenine deaminase [Desulfatiglandales bacterium]|nr:adenine deaminase [Desulfatiglandales bacterium]
MRITVISDQKTVEPRMNEPMARVSGNIVDIVQGRIYPGTIEIADGKIARIVRESEEYPTYIIPGFVDSHIHIESSMLTPSEFARVAVIHGTVGAVCDPHEIANVMGVDGIRYMIADGDRVPFKFFWGVPSCVPATNFETAGARVEVSHVEDLMKMEKVVCLSEVMNVPGVLQNDPALIAKIRVAQSYHKPVDGHAPGLGGEELMRYIRAGISTDHESLSKEEALEKIHLGMKIQIREGSAARNFDEMIPLAREHAESCMFCSDDKHPDDLMDGHIDAMVRRAIGYGIERIDASRMASLNPIRHYGLGVGLLQVGDAADFLIIDGFSRLNILKTFVKGSLVAQNGTTFIGESKKGTMNNFNTREKRVHDFAINGGNHKVHIIQAHDGQLVTGHLVDMPKVVDGHLVSDTERDILKMTVVNRYEDAPPSLGFIRGFGLKKGAIASSVAHDSHNIISVGANDKDMCRAINSIIRSKGGISVVNGDIEEALPLPIAGIMSDSSYKEVARRYTEMDRLSKALGSPLKAPFMTLSFMALLVIPEIKLGDRGLFDVGRFEFIDLFASS